MANTLEAELSLHSVGEEPTAEEGSVADVEEVEVEKPTPPMQLAIPGTRERISSSFGGAKPTSSEVRLLGGTQVLAGEYEKGEVVRLVVEAKITSVEGLDVTDEWGKVERTIRRHKGRMLSVQPFSEE